MYREFEWDYAKDIDPSAADVDLSADTDDPLPIGLHVKTTAGIVECTFSRPDDAAASGSEGIYIALGDYVKVRPMKVLSTSTAAGIVGLYRSKKPSLL